MRVPLLIAILFFWPFWVCRAQTEPGDAADSALLPYRVDAVVAKIGEESITLMDVLMESYGDEQTALSLYDAQHDRDEHILAIRKRILDEIINRKIVWKEYQKYRYPIPDDLIEDSIDRVAAGMANGNRRLLARKLRAMGSNMNELRQKARERVAVELMINEFCYRRVNATPRQQYEFYMRDTEMFTTPPQFEIAVLMIYDTTAQADTIFERLYAELTDSPALFADRARRYSDGPNAINGGRFGMMSFTDIHPSLREIIDDMFCDTMILPCVSDSFRLGESRCLLCIENYVPLKRPPFAEVRAQIKESIERPLRELRVREYLKKLRKKEVIRDLTSQPIDFREESADDHAEEQL